jgi:hypothetical protein
VTRADAEVLEAAGALSIAGSSVSGPGDMTFLRPLVDFVLVAGASTISSWAVSSSIASSTSSALVFLLSLGSAAGAALRVVLALVEAVVTLISGSLLAPGFVVALERVTRFGAVSSSMIS